MKTLLLATLLVSGLAATAAAQTQRPERPDRRQAPSAEQARPQNPDQARDWRANVSSTPPVRTVVIEQGGEQTTRTFAVDRTGHEPRIVELSKPGGEPVRGEASNLEWVLTALGFQKVPAQSVTNEAPTRRAPMAQLLLGPDGNHYRMTPAAAAPPRAAARPAGPNGETIVEVAMWRQTEDGGFAKVERPAAPQGEANRERTRERQGDAQQRREAVNQRSQSGPGGRQALAPSE